MTLFTLDPIEKLIDWKVGLTHLVQQERGKPE